MLLRTSWGVNAEVVQTVPRYGQVTLEVPTPSRTFADTDWLRMALVTEDGRIIGFGERFPLK